MRHIVLVVAGLVLGSSAGLCDDPTPPRGLAVVYAVTAVTTNPQATAVYALEPASGARHLVYADEDVGNRALLKMASSDVRGAARAMPPGGVYLMMGPVIASDPALHADALCRMPADAGAGVRAEPERVVSLPLCFGRKSPYGLLNRAPTFALSPNASLFAVYALRVGDTPLDRPTIRVLSASGEEKWRIALEHEELYVSDMALSPDDRLLVYSVLPHGDVHTLDERLLPRAGTFLADMAAQTIRRLDTGLTSAVAWGPKPEQVTLAVREGDIWSTRHVGIVLQVPSGEKVAELSLRDAVSSLAYSPDGRWLAVQGREARSDGIWVYKVSGGWGEPVDVDIGEGERMSLLGWARVAREAGRTRGVAGP